MSCRALLTALRDHAAGAESTPSLAAHLRACPACAQALEAERRLLAEVDATLGQVRVAEPSPALLVPARSLAHARPGTHHAARAMWAAAAVFVLSMSALLLQRVAWPPAAPSIPRAPAPSLREGPAVAPPVPPKSSWSPTARPTRPPPDALPFVPPGQEAVVLRFAALMTSGVAVVPTQLLDPGGPAAPIPEPPDLERPLLIIEPIWADEAPSEV